MGSAGLEAGSQTMSSGHCLSVSVSISPFSPPLLAPSFLPSIPWLNQVPPKWRPPLTLDLHFLYDQQSL